MEKDRKNAGSHTAKEEHCTLSMDDRPYEKCLRFGVSKLTDAELLAVIIRSGTRGESSVKLAERILALAGRENRLAGIRRLTIPELVSVPGIGEVKAIQILCVGELSKRIASAKARSLIRFPGPDSVAEYYMEQLRHEEQESVVCMMLDTKNHYLGEECIFRGTVNSTLLSTRELFLSAMRFRAVGILLVHNHPSGDPTPSEADRILTDRVAEAGELLDIHLLDHIIIGDRSYVSFRENGLLDHGNTYV